MNILITGHKGFIGKYLMKEISGIGLDIKDGNDILNCYLPKSDIVIHLAAQSSVYKSICNPFDDANKNILGTIRLVQKYYKQRFIFASSVAINGPQSPYGLSKYCAEKYIKLLCKDYIILRFPNIYGKGSKSVVDKFIKGKINIYGDGTATRNFVHVTDIIKAIKLSIEWKMGIYVLGYPNHYNILQLALACGKPKFYPKRKGDILHSIVKNTSPNWKPEINVIEYMKGEIKNAIRNCG